MVQISRPRRRERGQILILFAGANAYLAKPVTLAQLRQAIEALLGEQA